MSGGVDHLAQDQDRQLVALAMVGDKPAFETLVRIHGSAVRVLLRRMGAQAAVADDVAQDAFIAAWKGIGQLRADASFGAWVKRIAARLYVKQWRKNARYIALDAAPEEATSDDLSFGMDLDRALMKLSPAERMCVSLGSGAGFTHEELAAALQMPLGTVKSHVKRGLEKLKVHLSEGVAA